MQYPYPLICSVNFKKNEKVYNSANSEVLKALQEAENDPSDPGNDELFSHYYTLACMLGVLNTDPREAAARSQMPPQDLFSV